MHVEVRLRSVYDQERVQLHHGCNHRVTRERRKKETLLNLPWLCDASPRNGSDPHARVICSEESYHHSQMFFLFLFHGLFRFWVTLGTMRSLIKIIFQYRFPAKARYTHTHTHTNR